MNAEHDAVVYDLDGTLVRLDVDWGAVRRDVRALFEQAGAEAGEDLWTMLDRAAEAGLSAEVEEAIAAHEHDGARRSSRLPTADELPLELPTGVCSLNCERACHIALDAHGLADHVDAVVGRDSVRTRKPDPEPLLATLDSLAVPPERAVFVGDSERDEVAAERAGVAFRRVA